MACLSINVVFLHIKIISMKHILLFSVVIMLSFGIKAQQVIYDNGPIFNSVGTGSGGANESVLLTTTFGMGTIGFGHQSTAFNRVADDIVISDCYWRIDSVVFFAYQTNSTTTSTMTAVNVRLWDSIPDELATSNIIFGDTTTNRLIGTSWSGVYRVTETTLGNTARPIMRNVVDFGGLLLSTGTYWLDWQSSGSLASGPWAPPIVYSDTNATGNARQRTSSIWANLVDGGTGTPPQGLPFIIYGEIINITVSMSDSIEACDGTHVLLGGSPTATGGIGPLQYAWAPPTDLDNASLANPTASVMSSTMFYVVVSDSLTCQVMDSVFVNAHSIDPSVIATDSTIAATASGMSYQWVDCDNSYALISGETNQIFIPAVTGNYAVIVDNGFCADTSVCTSITVNGIDEWSQYLTLSPNPAGDVVNISIDIPFDETEYLLYDLNGRIIQHGVLSHQQTQIHVGSIPAGVYSLSLMLNGYPINQKLIKQ